MAKAGKKHCQMEFLAEHFCKNEFVSGKKKSTHFRPFCPNLVKIQSNKAQKQRKKPFLGNFFFAPLYSQLRKKTISPFYEIFRFVPFFIKKKIKMA